MIHDDPEWSPGRFEMFGFLPAGAPCRWCHRPLLWQRRPGLALVCLLCDTPEPDDQTLAELEASPLAA